MSNLARRGAEAALEVLGGAYRLATTPKLASNFSMSLDRDDLETARLWLNDRTKWNDVSVLHEYERAFAEWTGAEFAVAFQAGRKALTACIYALELKAGDEVIVPGFTCVLVPNAFEFANIKPVFCDIELDTYGPDLESVEENFTPRTKAIVVQHLFGLVCRDYEKILALAAKKGVRVIEDCAQSTGASLNGRRVGSRGSVGFFSSERSKIFNTIVGGIAITDQPVVAKRLRICSNMWTFPSEQQIERQLHNVALDYYQYKHPMSQLLSRLANLKRGASRITNMTPEEILGHVPQDYYTRMPPPIAALGLNQLRKVEAYNEKRRATALKWDGWSRRQGYRPPLVVDGSIPVFLRYPIMVEPERKADVQWARDELGVELGIWFKTNIHPTTRIVEGCPNANVAIERCVNLPTILG